MNWARWLGCGLFPAAITGFAAAPSVAGSTGGVIAVSMTVEESCHLDARAMVFSGMPTERDRAELRSSMVLTCTPSASYLVMLDNGRHGADGVLRMADAAGTRSLADKVLSDAAQTMRWGATPASAGGVANGPLELPVYARLSGSQAQTGAYSNTLTMTVAF